MEYSTVPRHSENPEYDYYIVNKDRQIMGLTRRFDTAEEAEASFRDWIKELDEMVAEEDAAFTNFSLVARLQIDKQAPWTIIRAPKRQYEKITTITHTPYEKENL